MCGRWPPWQRLSEHFGLRVTELPEQFAMCFSGASMQQVLTVRQLCRPP
jgi:hypothetical protein